MNQKDCLIRGIGEKITNKLYPRYYFLLVKPKSNCSTRKMYEQLQNNDLDYNVENDHEDINEYELNNNEILNNNVGK